MRTRLPKAIVATGALALVVPAIVLAASPPVKGGLYKGTYPVSAGPNALRVHVNKSGKKGNFTLPCAGLKRKGFKINKDDRYVVKITASGGPNPVFRAKGRFALNGRVTRGRVTRVGENGAECAPGSYQASLVR